MIAAITHLPNIKFESEPIPTAGEPVKVITSRS